MLEQLRQIPEVRPCRFDGCQPGEGIFLFDQVVLYCRLCGRSQNRPIVDFTVAQFRDATGASRKFVLPLVAELDARGVTRRRDDVRIAGPRLPER